ncbi:MAG: carboxy terminal-processing peptidase [Kiritimatiellae bacterium]|nr:carboxy terminal-processing peptidase [Kiritimatiellia bacterium]
MKRLLLGVLCVCALTSVAARAKKPARSTEARALARAKRLASTANETLGTSHLWRQKPNDMISRRAWTNLLESCDGDHMIFHAADIAEFEKSIDKLDDALRAGDFSFARRVRDVFRQRIAERTTFATNLLATTTFDFTGNGTYEYAREKAPWPAAGAARDALWTARVTGEVLDEWLTCETGGVKRAVAEVRKHYLNQLKEARRQKTTEMCDDFIAAIVSAYDAHSIYLTSPQYDVFRSQMDLTLCGIGAEWALKDGVSRVKRVIPGGPLAKDGHVKAGDSIIGVAPKGDGKIQKLAGKSESEIVPLFRGKKGTKITLEVRHANGETKQYTLVRDDVPMTDEAASSKVVEMVVAGQKRKVGYLRLPSFYSSMTARSNKMRTCSDDLRVELEKLKKADVCGVLFDLRGNNGGSLDDAVKVIGLFVRSGPAVRMHGAGGDTVLPVPYDAVVCDVPVVVLTSRGSASAGELVPGTLQDLGRAVIAGDTRTFGKGSAQTVTPIGGKRDGALVITDGRFYRVTGASTQFKGVASDILLPSACDEELFKGEQGLTYPLPWDELAPSAFNPSWDLNKFIPELKAASQARLAKNPKWAKHLQFVKDSEEAVMRTTMPLNKTARKAQLDRKTAVEDELERFLDEGFDPTKRDKDVVLDEGLNILADLVRLNGGRKLPAAKPLEASGLLDRLDDD